MKRVSVVAAVVASALASLTLGCLKMEVQLNVHPNGSASGSLDLAVDQDYWNMIDLTNFSYFEGENVTIWTEDGYVRVKTSETQENMSIEVTHYPGYTEYKIEADLSDLEMEEEPEVNLSDPLTQAILQSMLIKFNITMPGQIIDSDATWYEGSTAVWEFNGLTIQTVNRLYAKSRLYVRESPVVALVGLVAIALLLRPRKTSTLG